MGKLRGQRITYGVKSLTNLEIDADKDWKGKKITNIGEFGLSAIPYHSIEKHDTVASDTLLYSNDTQRDVVSQTMTKIKEIKLNGDLPDVRIKFDITTDSSQANPFAQIYKNGVALGQMQEGQQSETWTTFSEDFTTLKICDLIQIYGKVGHSGYNIRVRNMRLYFDEITRAAPTNQDP